MEGARFNASRVVHDSVVHQQCEEGVIFLPIKSIELTFLSSQGLPKSFVSPTIAFMPYLEDHPT